MAGKAGTSAQNVVAPTAAEQIQQQNAMTANNPEMASLLAKYGSGQLSLQDALSQGQDLASKASASSGADAAAAKNSWLDQQIKTAQDNFNNAKSALGGPNLGPGPDMNSLRAQLSDQYDQSHPAGASTGGANGYAEFQKELATNPLTAEQFASSQVQSDPLLGKYFGKGGMQDQVLGQQAGLDKNLADDRQALMGKGEQYGLTDQDLKAYGQASGNAARLFGSQEESLSSSLADRGLASGASGAAGAEFSGLNGNKNEMLASIQNNIAQNRINSAKDLAEFRTQSDASQAARNQQAALSLGNLSESAINADRSQNTGAKAESASELATAAGQGREQNEDAQSQQNIAFGQQQATRKKDFGEMLGDAVGGAVAGGIGNLAASPFNGAASMIGGTGTAAGTGIGKAVGTKAGAGLAAML